MLQLPGVRDVVARLVLGQDLHQRTQLQPPLLLRDPVTADRRGNVSTVVVFLFWLILTYFYDHLRFIKIIFTIDIFSQ